MPPEPDLIRALTQLRQNGPLAQRLAEAAIDRGYAEPLDLALHEEFSRLPEVFRSEDARLRLAAGINGRAQFVGR